MSDSAIDRLLERAATRARWAASELEKKNVILARSYAREARRLLLLVRVVSTANAAAQFVHLPLTRRPSPLTHNQ